MRRPSQRDWADYFAGRLNPRRRAALDGAAAAEPEVRRDRDRARRLRAALLRIGEQRGPELPWDHIGARIHWEVSQARRNAPTDSKWARCWLWGGLLTLPAVAGLLLVLSDDPGSQGSGGENPQSAVGGQKGF